MKELNIGPYSIRLYWKYGAVGADICRPTHRVYRVYCCGLVWPLLWIYTVNHATSTEG